MKNGSRGSIPADEQRVTVNFWLADGTLMWHAGETRGGAKLPEVSIGRTASERGLGFMISGKKTAFVLDRTQVENLHAFLACQIERLKPMRWPPSVINLPKIVEFANRAALNKLRKKAKRKAKR